MPRVADRHDGGMSGGNTLTDLARGIRAWWIIGLLAALSAMAGIFTLPPIDRDESRYAQATAQMLESGNFIEINYLDEPRNKKPVGIHWLQAAAVALVSDADDRQIWAYRLPSVLGAILAALACFWGGQRLVGREAAFAGAALFATTVLLGIEGGIAKTDAMLVGCTTLAMAALANVRGGTNPGWRTGLLFWASLGAGILIKGPVTPMVVGLTVAALVIWERRIAWLKPVLVWWGPLLAILIVTPWLISIQIATEGGFLRDALGDDLVPKLVSADERHGGLPGYHLLVLPLVFFPATLFLIPGAGRIVSALLGGDDRMAGAARFLIAWAIPTWLLFEILPTKLPHYVLPVYPALALAAGWGLVELAKAARWQRWASWTLFAIGAGVFAIFLPYVFITYGNNANWDAIRLAGAGFEGGFQLGYDMGAIARVFAGLAIFLALAVAALVSDRLRPGVLALVFAVLSGFGWHIAARSGSFAEAYAVRLADQVRAARAYSETITGLSPDEIVTASSFTEPSLAFSLGTDTVLGTTEEVLAFAEGRDEPTMVVLDLSRDAELRSYLTHPSTLAWSDIQPLAERFAALRICHRTLAAGTNYARGTNTVLAIAFTYCASDSLPQNPLTNEDTPNDPQD
ncbi:ArnT family glycosyltransferase [Maricaulis maris]|uniref:4-amino-4-deoxy-L-arabinose transferase-like glycosyltransferase n=1 Tax=Maricaulis maris TaxID=74318 RepID=A0A495D1A0_9PROT|nr:glycosyltransferase family 39 protein [Maricaulis maris]RKQ94211.1 4-amino-4-deoxy-L-arabinose transferase-like glycosyltransferase [Maricaulis maris]